jgi:hypothetical protein
VKASCGVADGGHLLTGAGLIEWQTIMARGTAHVGDAVHLFPDAEDLGRGGIDAIFAVALTEQERNQETW